MALRCENCGAPATAGKFSLEKGRGQYLGCASVDELEIPASQERRAPVPDDIAEGPAWQMTREAGVGGQLWRHQAEALGALDRGENVVVATATASGKSIGASVRLAALAAVHRPGSGTPDGEGLLSDYLKSPSSDAC